MRTGWVVACFVMLWAGAVQAAPTPTVVFMAGLGDGPGSFAGAMRRLGPNIPTYADRRDHGVGALTPDVAAQDLHARLQARGLRPPYVLVGHSIAGLYGLAFASRYPAEVSGLLLDDARLPGFDAACIAAGVRGCKIPALLYALLPPSDRAELDGAADMLNHPARPERWAKIRMTLLVAGQPSLGLGRDFQDLWIAHANAFAAALPQAHLILVQGSRHYIHKDAPGVFDSALAALLVPRP